MQNIEAGGMPARSGGRDEMYRAVVSELASLIDHIRKSRGPIESAIASDAAGENAAANNAAANMSLYVMTSPPATSGWMRHCRDCAAGLRVALRLLQGSMTPSEAA